MSMTKEQIIHFLKTHESEEDILEILSSVFVASISEGGTVSFDTGIGVTDPDSFLEECDERLDNY